MSLTFKEGLGIGTYLAATLGSGVIAGYGTWLLGAALTDVEESEFWDVQTEYTLNNLPEVIALAAPLFVAMFTIFRVRNLAYNLGDRVAGRKNS
ncbi:MAG: hypothetical protein AAB439_02280 [Patescibacteria group bacterium]